MDIIDEVTLRKACKGSGAAKDAVLEACMKPVYNIALKMTCNRQDAEDASQEALLKIYRNISSFRWKSAFSSWIYRITVNTCLDIIRKKKNANTVDIDELTYQIEDGAQSALEIYEKNERATEIKKAVMALDENYRAVILLCDYKQLSYSEIAEILEINIGTVKSRISRARAQLKKILEKKGLV